MNKVTECNDAQTYNDDPPPYNTVNALVNGDTHVPQTLYPDINAPSAPPLIDTPAFQLSPPTTHDDDTAKTGIIIIGTAVSLAAFMITFTFTAAVSQIGSGVAPLVSLSCIIFGIVATILHTLAMLCSVTILSGGIQHSRDIVFIRVVMGWTAAVATLITGVSATDTGATFLGTSVIIGAAIPLLCLSALETTVLMTSHTNAHFCNTLPCVTHRGNAVALATLACLSCVSRWFIHDQDVDLYTPMGGEDNRVTQVELHTEDGGTLA